MKWFNSGTKYIVRKRQLGDVLWIEPVIRQLASVNRRVLVHSKFNALFENYPLPNVHFVDQMSLWDKIKLRAGAFVKFAGRYIDLDGSYEKKPSLHFLHAYQQKAGTEITNEYPNIYLSEKERDNRMVSEESYAVLHLESYVDKSRNIYGVSWKELVKELNQQGFRVIQIGKNPAIIEGAIHVTTSLRQMMSLIYNAQLFIGVDSGPSHIASALNKTSLIMFGAINPTLRHFPQMFNGILLQQSAASGGKYPENPENAKLQFCKLDRSGNIANCSTELTSFLIQNVQELISKPTHDSTVH